MSTVQVTVALSRADLLKLQAFHASHFPSQDPPQLSDAHVSTEDYEDDRLGFYEDGVERTLTDEQIKMFRHSEIQRILQERRWQAEASEEEIASPSSEDKLIKVHTKEKENKANFTSDRPGKTPSKTFRFYDEPAEEDAHNRTLNYGEEDLKEFKSTHNLENKKFMWPKLG